MKLSGKNGVFAATPALVAASLFVYLLFGSAAAVSAVDPDAAQALMKANKCSTCHAMDKEKYGPSLLEIAKKYKGKPDAMDKLLKHLTVPTVVVVDGEKEEHRIVKPKDEPATRNLIGWILSLPAK